MKSSYTLFLVAACLALPSLVEAVSVAERAEDPSVKAEQESFTLPEGYQVELFAAEDLGIANPIAIRWDAKGRLWVLTTLTYAQLEPGQKPNDLLLILEDKDGDGKAETSSIWADGLNMPTGFALGHGGVYLSEGTDLIFLKDTDGDGKADQRKVVLSGFGTGDTHQNINSLSWGPAGDLWFSQGLHNMSRVETPWGIVRGEEAGFYRLRVKELRLEPFCMHSMASQNPWGIAFGRWGELFVKSNNRELGYITPGLVPTDHFQNIMNLATVAVTPGKSMGCELVESSYLPALKDHVLIAGYYSNRVTAFPLKEDGSGYAETEGIELLLSSHSSFRPVEVKVGPDGAIYVADWFNPIIGHYQASLRHPDRDKSHGRIWRIVREDNDLLPVQDLTALSTEQLFEQLASPERWNRYHAKRILSDLESAPEGLMEALRKATDPHHIYELAGVIEAHQMVTPEVITTCQTSEEPKLRAYGARMVGRWQGSIEMLAKAIDDEDARVRLEAVIAASHLGQAEAMRIALHALDKPTDHFILCSLEQCVHALSDAWLPALQSKQLTLDSPTHLTFALGAIGGEESAKLLDELLAQAKPEEERQLLLLLTEVGPPSGIERALKALPGDLELLQKLHANWPVRRVRPSGDLSALLNPALQSDDEQIRKMAILLAGNWRVQPLGTPIKEWATTASTSPELRQAAIAAFAEIRGPKAIEQLAPIATSDESREIQKSAVNAIASLNLKKAAPYSADMLTSTGSVDEASFLLEPYLNRTDGVEPLAAALESRELSKEGASHISQALTKAGRSEALLTPILNRTLGIADGALAYSSEFVAKLAEEVQAHGDAAKGKEVYQSPLLGCVACHAIGGQGGILGPDLSTVGSGLPLDLIVESVLWPERQLKEGYFSLNVTTKDGKLYNGYREKENADTLWMRDIASQQVVPIPLSQIKERKDVGTLMPAGLTASLSREQLRDLIRFLWEQRG